MSEIFCDDSFAMPEPSNRSYIKEASTNFKYLTSPKVHPSLWPSLKYHQCCSDSHKEIWITMFDEETTMELFPTPLSAPLSPLSVKQTNHHMAINFSAYLSNSSPAAKRKLPDDCSENSQRKWSSKLHSDKQTMSLSQQAVHNSSFKNFSWQSILSDNCHLIQQSVRRRLDLGLIIFTIISFMVFI